MALFSNKNSSVGLDLGSSAIKMVELVDRRRRLELSAYGTAELPNLLTDLAKSDDEAVSKTVSVLKDLFVQAEVSSDSIIAAIPSSSVFSTTLSIPKAAADEDKAVRNAAQQVVPAEIDNLTLSWTELPSQEEEKTVFLTAAPKQVVARYRAVVEQIQGELVALEVETFALVRSLLGEVKGPAVIADIGQLSTNYHLIINGTPRASHSINFGGKDVTAAIATAEKIGVEEAEEKKKQSGLQGLAPEVAARFFAEEKQLLSLYEDQGQLKNWSTVLIGGGARLKGLAEAWQKSSGKVVRIGDPWRGLSYPDKLADRLPQLGSQYAVAVGLARRVLQ